MTAAVPHLELASPPGASITGEIVTDRLALYGCALKAHVAMWPGMSAVLQDAAHSAR
jgi:hypothetical protein